MGPRGAGRQHNGARPVRRPGTNVPWHHGGPPFVKLIGPRLKNWTNFNRPERRGVPSATQPGPVPGDLQQQLLSGSALVAEERCLRGEARPGEGGWGGAGGHPAVLGDPLLLPRWGKELPSSVSLHCLFCRSEVQRRQIGTCLPSGFPKPKGSASLIWGRWVPFSVLPTLACAQLCPQPWWEACSSLQGYVTAGLKELGSLGL